MDTTKIEELGSEQSKVELRLCAVNEPHRLIMIVISYIEDFW